jgi:hypothetical protein
MNFLAVIAATTLLACSLMCNAAITTHVLHNSRLSIRFSPTTGGIESIRDLSSSHDFIPVASVKPLLWRIHLQDTAGQSIIVDNTQQAAPIIRKDGSHLLQIQWKQISIPGDDGTLDVSVKARLNPKDAIARLWIQTSVNSQRFSIWQVEFPVISSLSQPSLADVAAPRSNWGILYHHPDTNLIGSYPSAGWPMQFVLDNEGDNGLYLAAEDPHGWFKKFDFTPGKEFALTTYAENIGVLHNSFHAPYPFAIGVYHGDWISGCKVYRAWALRQPWTSRGKLAQRKDTPESFKDIAAWFLTNGSSDQVTPQVEQFRKAIDAPVAVHWYDWHEIPFDTHYPDYFPAKPGFAKGVQLLTKDNVVVMPYINGRLWDSQNVDFTKARPYATKNEKNDLNIEVYGSGAKLAVMCPSTSYWQDKVFSIVRKLVTDEHVNAIYIDQISSAEPRFCFDPTHHHPLGGGYWWVQSYCKMLGRIKAWCHQEGRDVALTSENNAEPYMADLDGFLIWNPRYPNEIPMDAMVYSGYTIYYSTPITLNDGDTAFALAQGRDFIWGAQNGWMGPALLEPQNAKKLAYLGTLARARVIAKPYLLYGELLGFLPDDPAVPDLTATWRGWSGEAVPVKLPAVMNAVWKGEDNSVGVLLTNTDTVPHTYRFDFNGEVWGLSKAKRLTVTQNVDGVTSPSQTIEGNRFSKTLSIAGRSVVLLSISQVKTQ